MGILLVIVGVLLIGYGMVKFLQLIGFLLRLISLPFLSERKLDRMIFKNLKKGEEYKTHENAINDLLK